MSYSDDDIVVPLERLDTQKSRKEGKSLGEIHFRLTQKEERLVVSLVLVVLGAFLLSKIFHSTSSSSTLIGMERVLGLPSEREERIVRTMNQKMGTPLGSLSDSMSWMQSELSGMLGSLNHPHIVSKNPPTMARQLQGAKEFFRNMMENGVPEKAFPYLFSHVSTLPPERWGQML